jgi:8-amino-7-oxononanoate synthase
VSPSRLPTLSRQEKERLILEARARRQQRVATPPQPTDTVSGDDEIPEASWRFDLHPAYQQISLLRAGAAHFAIPDPYFKSHDGTAGATTFIAGRECINFASYNYLGLCGHPEVNAAASSAITSFGTSVSASRMVSGERPVHAALEEALAAAYEVEAAVAMVSGHATNVTVIGHLLGPRDLILHDEFIHNSSLQGALLSGARRIPFPHNDWQALEQILIEQRRRYERVLVVVEGLYSMDGDYPELPRFIELRRKHRCWLMVDEAHSFGVLGATGLGIREQFGLSGEDVDIWMGTLSKTLAGCGGYIAGSRVLIDNLRHLAPGFLYSVGMSPPLAAASCAALQVMLREPVRVERLRARSALFLNLARQAGLDTGTSAGCSVVPVLTHRSVDAVRLSAALLAAGINVQPIFYPAVPENSARLRFFLSSEHTADQVRRAVEATASAALTLGIASL